MQIKIQLPQEESKILELTGAITIAELDALFSSAGVVFWIVNGYPAGKENLLFEGDNVIGIDQVKANHRGRPYTWGAKDFPFLRSSSKPNLFSPPETQLEKPKMVLLSPGSFVMGVGENETPIPRTTGFYSDDALPARNVHVHHSFEIAQLPITRKQYQTTTGSHGDSFGESVHDENALAHPQVSVSWYEAIVFCNLLSRSQGLPCAYAIDAPAEEIEEWGDLNEMDFDELVEIFSELGVRWSQPQSNTGYRLPTEAEWEYACRAGNSNTRYGHVVDDIAWTYSNSGSQLRSVGQLQPNDWGLYDMLGNVFEWCWDWYDGDYYGSRPSSDINPLGPESGDYKVVRGGDFLSNGVIVRASFRGEVRAYRSTSSVGFRVVRTIK